MYLKAYLDYIYLCYWSDFIVKVAILLNFNKIIQWNCCFNFESRAKNAEVIEINVVKGFIDLNLI